MAVSGGPVRPAARSARANATVGSATGTGAGPGDQLVEPADPDPLLVLPVLEDGAEGRVGGRLVEVVATEGAEGGGPVDRLGHTGGLVDAGAPDGRGGGRHLAGQPLGHVGRPQP